MPKKTKNRGSSQVPGADQTQVEIIVRCPDGHETLIHLLLPMSLTEYARILMRAGRCQACDRLGCVMLLGPEFWEARSRLMPSEKKI